MTLATAIAATSPLIWWKLGEGSGSVAVDSGSAAKNGTLSGDFGWVSPGVESGTSALRLFSGAAIRSGGLGFSGSRTWSLGFYFSAQEQGASTQYPIVGIGDITAPLARGPRLMLTVSTSLLSAAGGIGATFSTGLASLSFPATFWHGFIFGFDAPTKTSTFWADGAIKGGPSVQAGTIANLLTSDELWIKSDTPVVLAQIVVWDRVVTNAEANAITNFQTAWPYGLPVNAVTVPDTFTAPTVDLSPVTTQLDTVIANQTTLDTVTLPSLADVLSTIEGMITTVESDIAAIPVPDLGALLNTGTLDRLTLPEATTGPTSGEFSIPFLGSVFGVIVRCTTIPAWYGTRGPAAVWREPPLARLSIVRGVDELFSQLVHNDHYMLYPIPGAISFYPGSVIQLPVYPAGFTLYVVFNEGVEGQVFWMQLP